MRGGARKNAGRSKKLPEDRKISKSIKLSPNILNKINELDVEGCESFSAKCQYR